MMKTEEILTILRKPDPSGVFARKKYLEKNYPDILDFYERYSTKCNFKDMQLSQLRWHIVNNVHKIPRCPVCNKVLKYKNGTIGYPKFCSNSCSTKHSDSKEKLKESMLKNHGVTHSSLTQKSALNRKKRKIETLKKICETSHIEFIELNNNDYIKAKCTIHDNTFEMNIGSFHNRYSKGMEVCGVCLTPKYTGENENKIIETIKNINPSVKFNLKNRSILNGKEIDIFIEDLNIGIEHNGVYWHSELHLDNNYHKRKTELAEEKGIQLIHIWEDDWLYKNDIIKSRLNNILGKSERIFARKTVIREVSHKDSESFLNNNHLQSACNASVRLGLYYNEELVSLMTFGKRRRSLGQSHVEDNYELYRYCNKLNLTVVGGASRLFKRFISVYNPVSIISYADRCWSFGNLYEKLGFIFVGDTEPGYSYLVDGIRQHRFNWRKDILVSKGYDENKTEREIMNELGYFRIYDVGHKKYEWKKEL